MQNMKTWEAALMNKAQTNLRYENNANYAEHKRYDFSFNDLNSYCESEVPESVYGIDESSQFDNFEITHASDILALEAPIKTGNLYEPQSQQLASNMAWDISLQNSSYDECEMARSDSNDDYIVTSLDDLPRIEREHSKCNGISQPHEYNTFGEQSLYSECYGQNAFYAQAEMFQPVGPSVVSAEFEGQALS